MSLSPGQKADFVKAYTRALVTSWSDEEYAGRLVAHPHEALAEVGLYIPADASVEIVRTAPGDSPETGEASRPAAENRRGQLDHQLALWEEGLRTGQVVLHIPATPQVNATDLELDDLADVAGGLLCCCCPCSSCT
jgi:hypothetical protein